MRTKPFEIFHTKAVVAIATAAFLFSCANKIESIEKLTNVQSYPDEKATDVEIVQTDSGRVKMTLTTPQYDAFAGESPYTEFPKGVHVKFYNSEGDVYSEIKANYAINLEHEMKMVAKNDVVVVNSEQEQLNTEHLEWLREEKKLISDAFVKITTPDEVLYGDGLDAAEDFSTYKIRNIKGVIKVKDEPTKSATP